MLVAGDDRRVVGDGVVVAVVIHDHLPDLGFLDLASCGGRLGDRLPGHGEPRRRDHFGLAVHRHLVVVPGRFESLDQVTRGDDLAAGFLDQFDRTGVDA